MAAQSYSLLVESVTGIHWKPGPLTLHRDTPNLYVAIDVDDIRAHRTHAKRDFVAKWNDVSTLLADHQSSVILLRVFHDNSLGRKDICLAKAEIEISALLGMCASKEDQKGVAVKLNHVDEAEDMPSPTLVVHLETIRHVQAGAIAIANSEDDIANLGPAVTGSCVAKVVDRVTQHGDLVSGLGTVVSKLAIIVSIGDEITKIHPYANAAWQVLTSVYKVVKKQEETNQKIVQLVQTMVTAYSFAEDVESLAVKIKRFQDPVTAIVKQTAECAIFIREYTEKGFYAGLMTQISAENLNKIDDFVAAFVKLKESLDRGLVTQTAFVSTKALETVENLVQSEKLKTLNPVDMNASLRQECLSGTRRDMLSSITRWLMTPSDSETSGSILWLYGVAGSGKSTIATSVSQYFRELDRLGAFLFFDRNDRAASSPSSVIRTIAFQLARSNPHLRSTICAAIDHDSALVDAPIETQFQKLLLEPLTAVQNDILGPIIIILDALDECGDPGSRRRLLVMLSNEFSKLPAMFRFFITSRPDSDIAIEFMIQPWIIKIHLDITLPSSVADIRHYIDDQMLKIRQAHPNRNLDSTWPGEAKTAALAAYSSGLFIWASTATRFILKAYNPTDNLDALLRKDPAKGFDLDDLYAVALRAAGSWGDSTFVRDAQIALAAVVLGKVPLSDVTIDKLFGLEPDHSSSHVFGRLGCVLQWSHGDLAQTLHSSFGDYLTDRERSGREPWFIDHTILGQQLARGCLRVLKTGLRFNSCGLDDSHIRNTDVPDLSDRISTHILPHLSYSSRFWANHIQAIDSDEMLADIKDLMYSKFLFWLEILSVLKETRIAMDALTIISKLSKDHDEPLAHFATDAIKFVIAFVPAIAQSVPHIYLSAVPLAPRESHVWRQFSWLVARKPEVQSSLGGQWPRLQISIEGHSRAVTSVAFSPDGEFVVSGSNDKSLRVWDAQTGALIIVLTAEDSGDINCVAFSPDGTRIVSGSDDKTVRVWDARTGALVIGRLVGHDGIVYSAAFSPNGDRIISGSEDKTVRVWNAQTGALVMGPLAGHSVPVSSVAFSPTGDRIVSGSADETVRVFDARTGALITAAMVGHSETVCAVAFSPNGEHIISVSLDTTVCIWDARTGALVTTGTKMHSKFVCSVAFSPDGKQIAFGSEDRTVRVWDPETGALIAGPFEDHNDTVFSVCFSPDGRRIALGSGDHMVRVWDAQPPPIPGGSLDGHRTRVHSVSFAPNGDQILSGSADETVRVWDAQTGTPITVLTAEDSGEFNCVAFSSDGKHIVSGSDDKTVRVWDAQTGALVIGPLVGHDGVVLSVSFSPNGDRIVSGSMEKTVRLWDVQTGALVIGPLVGHNGVVTSVAFSPNGDRIVSGSMDETLRVWDAQTGALVVGPLVGHDGVVLSVAFSSNGDRIVSGSTDETVRVWDVQTGRPIAGPFEPHSREIWTVAFSPNGKQILSGSQDGTVCVYDAHTGTLVAGPFKGHSSGVRSAAFSPDGGRIVSGGFDGTIRVIELNPDHAPNLFGDGSTLDNGWILNSKSKLILWVPPWFREGLYYPQTSLVISARGTTKLDISRFIHGTSWQDCIDLNVRRNNH